MYCKKCGTELDDNVKFCPKCSAPAANDVLVKKDVSSTFKDLISNKYLIISAAIIVLLILIITIAASVKPGYEKLMDQYFEAQETANAELYYDIVSENWMMWYDDEPLEVSKSEFIGMFQDELSDKLIDYTNECGSDISITYEITNVYEATDEQIMELKNDLEYLNNASVTDACVLNINYTVEGNVRSQNMYYPNGFLVIKADGKWCIPRGSVDVSWYES